ncbi:hypothetical protein SLOPH_2228 [Spraguea lophii 42_110]|uniref:Trm112p-like protein n=1 Tax=Spraguea lophii (strain 42_110) TaxID=1358809 RepID=S7XLC0_SPRLO|nr:hypothetical protein SLOPH_2228 [Spraguea lophii 42_110]
MKPFTFSILCCKDCNLNSKLKLSVKKNIKIDTETDTDFLKAHLDIFLVNDHEILKNLINSFKEVEESYKIELNEIEDLEKLYLFLFANEVEEGKLLCEECNKEYNIEGGIVDFLN